MWGIDVLQMPLTESGNKYCIVLVDYLTKWPEVYAVPDQTSLTIAQILTREFIPRFGVPAMLLSDRGANFLSTLMSELYQILGIEKLNTTPYHAMANGLVERMNRTLIEQVRAAADQIGSQWDTALGAILLAYRSVPHSSTGESPSYLVYGVDLRLPIESAYLSDDPQVRIHAAESEDFIKEVQLSLSLARERAQSAIKKAQKKQELDFNSHFNAKDPVLSVGDRVVMYHPEEATSKNRKVTRPWYGPYRVVSINMPNATVRKVFSPSDALETVHCNRLRKLLPSFPKSWYWYGGRRLKRVCLQRNASPTLTSLAARPSRIEFTCADCGHALIYDLAVT